MFYSDVRKLIEIGDLPKSLYQISERFTQATRARDQAELAMAEERKNAAHYIKAARPKCFFQEWDDREAFEDIRDIVLWMMTAEYEPKAAMSHHGVAKSLHGCYTIKAWAFNGLIGLGFKVPSVSYDGQPDTFGWRHTAEETAKIKAEICRIASVEIHSAWNETCQMPSIAINAKVSQGVLQMIEAGAPIEKAIKNPKSIPKGWD